MRELKQWARQAALAQLALDYNAREGDFLSGKLTVTENTARPGRRQYTLQPPLFQMTTTGQGAVLCAYPGLHGGLRA